MHTYIHMCIKESYICTRVELYKNNASEPGCTYVWTQTIQTYNLYTDQIHTYKCCTNM